MGEQCLQYVEELIDEAMEQIIVHNIVNACQHSRGFFQRAPNLKDMNVGAFNDSALSLGTSSSIALINDRNNSQSDETSNVVSRRTLVYDEDTSPIREIQKQLRLINPPSKTIKEVYIKIFLFVYAQYVTMFLSFCCGI